MMYVELSLTIESELGIGSIVDMSWREVSKGSIHFSILRLSFRCSRVSDG